MSHYSHLSASRHDCGSARSVAFYPVHRAGCDHASDAHTYRSPSNVPMRAMRLAAPAAGASFSYRAPWPGLVAGRRAWRPY